MKIYATFEDELNKVGDPDNIKFTKAGDVGLFVSQLLQYALIIAGLVLFAGVIAAGFTILTSGGDPKKTEMGKNRLTSALIGFLIVFAAFWIARQR